MEDINVAYLRVVPLMVSLKHVIIEGNLTIKPRIIYCNSHHILHVYTECQCIFALILLKNDFP